MLAQMEINSAVNVEPRIHLDMVFCVFISVVYLTGSHSTQFARSQWGVCPMPHRACHQSRHPRSGNIAADRAVCPSNQYHTESPNPMNQLLTHPTDYIYSTIQLRRSSGGFEVDLRKIEEHRECRREPGLKLELVYLHPRLPHNDVSSGLPGPWIWARRPLCLVFCLASEGPLAGGGLGPGLDDLASERRCVDGLGAGRRASSRLGSGRLASSRFGSGRRASSRSGSAGGPPRACARAGGPPRAWAQADGPPRAWARAGGPPRAWARGASWPRVWERRAWKTRGVWWPRASVQGVWLPRSSGSLGGVGRHDGPGAIGTGAIRGLSGSGGAFGTFFAGTVRGLSGSGASLMGPPGVEEPGLTLPLPSSRSGRSPGEGGRSVPPGLTMPLPSSRSGRSPGEGGRSADRRVSPCLCRPRGPADLPVRAGDPGSRGGPMGWSEVDPNRGPLAASFFPQGGVSARAGSRPVGRSAPSGPRRSPSLSNRGWEGSSLGISDLLLRCERRSAISVGEPTPLQPRSICGRSTRSRIFSGRRSESWRANGIATTLRESPWTRDWK